jgi:hypothetical protein
MQGGGTLQTGAKIGQSMAHAWLASDEAAHACGGPLLMGRDCSWLPQLMDMNLILPGGAIIADNTLMKVSRLFHCSMQSRVSRA